MLEGSLQRHFVCVCVVDTHTHAQRGRNEQRARHTDDAPKTKTKRTCMSPPTIPVSSCAAARASSPCACSFVHLFVHPINFVWGGASRQDKTPPWWGVVLRSVRVGSWAHSRSPDRPMTNPHTHTPPYLYPVEVRLLLRVPPRVLPVQLHQLRVQPAFVFWGGRQVCVRVWV